MCPIDKIWSEDEETCVELEPTAEPTATTESPVTPEPTATSEQESPDPTIPEEEPTASIDDDQNGPATEPDVSTPGAGTSDQFTVPDWCFWCSDFEAPAGLQLFEQTCDHVIDPTDSLEEILPRCRAHYDDPGGAPGFTYDVFIDGRLVWTSYNGGGFWSSTLPGGDYRIVARYHGERFNAPWATCGAWDNEQDDLEIRIGPGQVHSNGDYFIPDVPAGVDNIGCVFSYVPILKTDVTVDLIAYRCPQRVVDEFIVEYRDLVLLCGVPGGEVEMQIVHGGGVANQFTHLGLASFNDLPAGAIQVREAIPEGYGVPLVYCMVTGPEGQTIKQQDLEIIGPNYYVTVANVPPGSSVLCEFFNVPGETPDITGPPATDRPQDLPVS
jgi:hypothetical protein